MSSMPTWWSSRAAAPPSPTCSGCGNEVWPTPSRPTSVRGAAVLGICGGFQMLCRDIDDGVESGGGTVPGLGLFDVGIEFAAEKTLSPLGGVVGGQRPGAVTRSTTAGLFAAMPTAGFTPAAQRPIPQRKRLRHALGTG